MPLLTPLRRKGITAPMLKEANYSQYLPHSREPRSCRGQTCETFLQPAAAGPPSQLSLPLSAFHFPDPPPAPPLHLSSVPSLTVFLLYSVLITLSNIHPVICFHFGTEPHVSSHPLRIFVAKGQGICQSVCIKLADKLACKRLY